MGGEAVRASFVAVFLAVAVSGAAVGALPRFAEGAEVPEWGGVPRGGGDDHGLVHIAMTLDTHYLLGSMAMVYSLLKHASFAAPLQSLPPV